MSNVISVFCDESCHLEKDRQPVMVLGAVWCPQGRVRQLNDGLRAIKRKHGKPPAFEVKWTKVSAAGLPFYRDLVEFFFAEPDLHFRVLVADKGALNHPAFAQSHDDWYYKMYFDLLKVIFSPTDSYQVYLDIKDTRSAGKVRRLHEVLCNSHYDFAATLIQRLQSVRSHEIELLQLCDLLVGVVGYANRGLTANAGKVQIVEQVRRHTGYSLLRNTLLLEPKFNLFVWHGREAQQ